jgi:hypothetical protein
MLIEREIDRQIKRQTWFSIFLIPVERDRQTEEETRLFLHLPVDERDRQTEEETHLVLHLPYTRTRRDHDLWKREKGRQVKEETDQGRDIPGSPSS